MKPINKVLELATAYKEWIDKIDANKERHPEYNSSNNKYYHDVVANLLWVQKGLCAYTETYLINVDDVHPNLWEQGKFRKFEFMGQLDHYDSTLKTDKGWDWTNFFMIHTDVNTKHKRAKKVNYLLKPDNEDFDPFYFLHYDVVTHFFLPNIDREPEQIIKIREDIYALGLNFKPISDYRKIMLTPIIEKVKFRQLTIGEAREQLNSFYTAFEMAINQIVE